MAICTDFRAERNGPVKGPEKIDPVFYAPDPEDHIKQN
jgi:hypothetical protein